MIQSTNLYLQYSQTREYALQDINFIIDSGELVFFVGESGAGKTSLTRILLASQLPSHGSITIGDFTIDSNSTSKSVKLSIRQMVGTVFQDFRLFYGRSVLENIYLGLRVIAPLTTERKSFCKTLLEKIGLKHKQNQLVDHLSFGERQRIAIARALARKPKYIIADEPTGNLDQNTAIDILKLLVNFKDDNTTLLVTTHATHLMTEFDRRVIELHQGKLLSDSVLSKGESR